MQNHYPNKVFFLLLFCLFQQLIVKSKQTQSEFIHL